MLYEVITRARRAARAHGLAHHGPGAELQPLVDLAVEARVARRDREAVVPGVADVADHHVGTEPPDGRVDRGRDDQAQVPGERGQQGRNDSYNFV